MTLSSPRWYGCVLLVLALACKGGSEGGTSTPPDTTPPGSEFTLSGKVLDTSSNPVPNVQVLVFGKTPVKTDASGAFSVPDVTSPYDIVAVSDNKQDVTVIKGLTIRNPTLFVTLAGVPSPRLAKMEGTVSGGRTPYGTTNTPALTFIAPEASSDIALSDSGTGAYSADVAWQGAATLTGTLHALQAIKESRTAAPTSYTGYGRRDNVTLTEGTTLRAQDITLSSVTGSTLAGTITKPDGFTIFSTSVSLQSSTIPTLPLFSVFSSSSTFSYVVPLIGQSTYSLQVFASTEGFARSVSRSRTGLSAGSTTPIALPEPPRSAQPADKATDVTRSTVFSWSAFAEGVHYVTFSRASLSPGEVSVPYVTVVTRDTSTTLPDLSAVGINLPVSAAMTWQVSGVAPIASTDALLGAQLSDPKGKSFDTKDNAAGSSEQRAFSTASAP